MKKIEYFGLGDPKDSQIMPADQYPHSVSLNDEVTIDPKNQNSVHSIQTWDLDRIFHTLDRNGDGMVEVDNIQGLLEKLGLHYFCDDNMKIMMDFPEQINFDDFCRHLGSLWEGAQSTEIMEEEIQKGELREAFSVFDKDGDGFITPSELQEVLLSLGLKEGQELENCVTMITRFDKDF